MSEKYPGIDLGKLVADSERARAAAEGVFPRPLEHDGNAARMDAGDSIQRGISELVSRWVDDEERVYEKAVIELLRARGWVVEKPGAGENISGAAVARFRSAWHAADREGKAGNRVRAGLEAARPFLNLEAVAKIDELAQRALGRESEAIRFSGVLEQLAELREMIAPGVPKGKTARRCRCRAHAEGRGGVYSELMLEPEPECPDHGLRNDGVCDSCGEQATEFYSKIVPPVQLCDSCDHDARRSGWEPGQ